MVHSPLIASSSPNLLNLILKLFAPFKLLCPTAIFHWHQSHVKNIAIREVRICNLSVFTKGFDALFIQVYDINN